ncbi:MAG: HAD family hydrolase [Thermoplasmata archaeon]
MDLRGEEEEKLKVAGVAPACESRGSGGIPGEVTAVFFDAYGTILDVTGVHLECVRRILRDRKPERAFAEREKLENEFHAYWDSRERVNLLWAAGRDFRHEPFVTQLQLNVRSLRETFERFGIEGDAERGVELWVELTRKAGVFSDVHPALEAMPETMTLGVVSNSDNYPLIDILKREGLDFEAVVTSQTARAYKPSPRIFRYALKAAGASPEKTLFIGDTPEVDIPGARAAGIRTVWLNRSRRGLRIGEPEPDIILHGLSELPYLLQK